MKRTILNLFIVGLLLIVVAHSCKKEPVSGITLEPDFLYIGVGQTEALAAIIIPENAANKKVSWESSNSHVATVYNGTVTAISHGKTTITVTTQDGSRTAKCFVTVCDPIEPEMVLVEGGTFIMGCTDGQCWNNELPAHLVTVSSFKIAIYPVTQKQWVSLMGNNPSYHEGDDMPVHYVSWNNVQEFIRILNAATGKSYRLPTEAEWEYAARGGNQSMKYRYSGSNNINEVAWYERNSKRSVQPVGTKKPNELGIYDMSGNVREWCQDEYRRIYTNEPQTNPQGPPIGTHSARMMRGGDACDTIGFCRVSTRLTWFQDYPGHPPGYGCIFGFRLVHPAE
ncbi:MAG: SUMF1/EgtB/PvdO family nonheme iron enzyme [Bacteroidetes bacterium]|nr:SUMF1/EgtB/PvdO family nonheme iron enzyme [Bacteroidota bacterium]MCL2303534.1 SUMF1/EgtB/PvdO family nonheme iron enzyme [Lentimicrobiaceae bacterium]